MTSISPDCTYWHVEPDNLLNKQQQSFEIGNTKINSTLSHFQFLIICICRTCKWGMSCKQRKEPWTTDQWWPSLIETFHWSDNVDTQPRTLHEVSWQELAIAKLVLLL